MKGQFKDAWPFSDCHQPVNVYSAIRYKRNSHCCPFRKIILHADQLSKAKREEESENEKILHFVFFYFRLADELEVNLKKKNQVVLLIVVASKNPEKSLYLPKKKLSCFKYMC